MSELDNLIEITITHRLLGRTFTQQEQYYFEGDPVVQSTGGCAPCGRKPQVQTYYRVIIDGTEYLINSKYATITRELRRGQTAQQRVQQIGDVPDGGYGQFTETVPGHPDGFNPSGEISRFNRMGTIDRRSSN